MANQQTTAGGPSAREWRDHKNTIIQLYQTMPQKEVSSVMKHKYNFVATKRMYDTRFRQWKVSKVLKKPQKESMIREISENSHALGQGRPLATISPKDLKKVLRYAQTRYRDARRQGFVSDSIELPDEQWPYYGIPGRHQAEGDILEQVKEAHNAVQTKKADSEEVNISPSQLTTPSSSGEVLTDDGTAFSGEDIDGSLLKGMLFDSSRSNSVACTSTPPSSLSLSPSLSPSPSQTQEDWGREYALFSIKNFFKYSLPRLQDAPTIDSILDVGSRPQTSMFWDDMKTYIYLLKTSNKFADGQARIVEAWNKTSQLIEDAISDHPFDFCRELLVVLSPTNVRDSMLRRQILSNLADHTAAKLGTYHPIPSLCEALCASDNSTNTFDFALESLLSLVERRFGAADAASCKITTSLITSMRRGGELHLARLRAERALQTAQQSHGSDSDETRKLAVQLGHILTSLGDHGKAHSLRMEVVQEPLRWPASSYALSGIATQYRTDKIAMHVMEDLAEYFVRFANIQEGISWLSRANLIAQDRFKDSSSTNHISDKLDNLLSGNLNGQVVDEQLPLVPM